jgi:hypothetical protein
MASPFLIAILILAIFLMIIVVILFVRSRRTLVATTSTPSRVPCSGPPPTPVNLTASNPQADVLTLTWSRTTTALSYTAYLADRPNFTINQALQSRTTSNNSASFGNLALGTNYHLKVRATNSCGDSALSNEISFVMPFTFPRRFVIQNRLNPALKLCDVHENPFAPSDRVNANAFCTTGTSLFFYQIRDKTIRQISRPNRCLTRTNNPNGIFFNQCGSNDPNQVWEYSNQTTNLCDVILGNDCVNLSPNFTPEGGVITHGTPINNILSDWLITGN